MSVLSADGRYYMLKNKSVYLSFLLTGLNWLEQSE